MFIKEKGTYVVCGSQFSALIFVIGSLPYFTIVSGIELDPFIQHGKVVPLDKDSYELQMIAEQPDKFVFAPIAILGDTALPGLRKSTAAEQVEFNEVEFRMWCEYYMQLKEFDLSLSKLAVRIMSSDKSYQQAQMIIKMIEQKYNK